VNTQRVNGAAGVILAALTQNRTPAGIALALESAGLLMTPETAADMASVSADAVRVAEESVAELKREHEANARLRGQLAGLESLRLPEKLKVDSIHREYRNGYVHALADMRDVLEMPDALTRTFAPTQALREDKPRSRFFQPGRLYASGGRFRFRCDAVTTRPDTGEQRAVGWHGKLRTADGEWVWTANERTPDDWDAWTEVADPVADPDAAP
jgi:hypothetical protein